MKKLLSLMMLCLCGLAFVSCETDEDQPGGNQSNNSASKNKFKSCVFEASPDFSADVLGLYDITMTYTAMDGSIKEVKPDQTGKLYVRDESSTLPATVKYEVKAVKKATYDDYKASKKEFDLVMHTPGAHAVMLSTDGKEEDLLTMVKEKNSTGVGSSDLDAYFTIVDEYLNFTFEGTFTKTETGCVFKAK